MIVKKLTKRQVYFPAWANVHQKTQGKLGYPAASPISQSKLATPAHNGNQRQLPKDVSIAGLTQYLAVEKALHAMTAGHRILLMLDQGILRFDGVDLRTTKKRADWVGMTVGQYEYKLQQILDAIIE